MNVSLKMSLSILISISIFSEIPISILIFSRMSLSVSTSIFSKMSFDIGIDTDINIFKNGLIDIDIFKNSHIDINIFKKCWYIDNRYGLSIYRTPLPQTGRLCLSLISRTTPKIHQYQFHTFLEAPLRWNTLYIVPPHQNGRTAFETKPWLKILFG